MGFNNLFLFNTVNQIKQTIEQAQLPIGTVYYMLQSLTNEIGNLYNQTIQQEMNVYLQNQEKIKETVQDGVKEAIETHPLVFTEEKEKSGQE